jgi:hypothetical protein
VLLTVRTRVADEALRGQVRQWLATAEISAMRAIPGVRGARLIEEPEGALVEEYVFGGEPEYENYLANFSAEHRGALRERFGAPVERSFHKALLCAAA